MGKTGQNRSIAPALQITRWLSFAISGTRLEYVGTRKFADRHRCVDGVRFSESGQTPYDDIGKEKRFLPTALRAGALCALLLLSGSSWPESAPTRSR